ncbi:MAG: DUF4142 domain-containing protein [Gammaproteobacteria bacterium]|nr:DUF4142 domain-containing protein [Gammaproteobacteria bacterium]
MKSKLICSLLFLASFSFASAYALDNTNEKSSVAPVNQESTADQQKAGEVIGWLIVLNKNEIAAANEALAKKTNPMVRSYAAMLKQAHSQNLQKTISLSKKIDIKPVENEPVVALKEKGKEELSTLKPMDGKDFQVAYIDAMVKGHAEALDKVNEDLKNTTNPQLKQHLEATRASVTSHLEKAKMIQSKLQSSNS